MQEQITAPCCFLEKGASLALAAVLCNGMVGCIMNVRLSALEYCQHHSEHLLAFRKTAKALKQCVKFAQT